MKKLRIAILTGLLGAGLVGCTANERARSFGGTLTIDLPAGQTLVNATWKNTELWYLTRPRAKSETAQTYEFVEKSTYGMMEGKVVFREN
jgi:hypothetical protein